MSKIILGTANLNQKYGFLKKTIEYQDFKKIINKSKKRIGYIDTSNNYKKAHKLLGKLNLGKIKIITKISIPKSSKINPKLWVSNSVKKITQPMLIAHGDEDVHILPEYGKQLFENLASKEKEFILVEGADHNYIHVIGGIEYQNRVFNFIKRQLK